MVALPTDNNDETGSRKPSTSGDGTIAEMWIKSSRNGLVKKIGREHEKGRVHSRGSTHSSRLFLTE